jgi:maleylacetate reductase
MGFTYESLPGRVVFARGGAAEQLESELDRLGVTNVMLIATRAEISRSSALIQHISQRVGSVFSEVEQHVPAATAVAAREQAASTQADGLVCIGGGSTTGTAKIVALTSGLPIIAVPTTYAGSEVTPVWGMTTDARKETGRDQAVMPRSIVYDSELTQSLPVELAIASGFNAMAHCVESFWGPGANPVTSLHAAEGIRVLAAAMVAVSTGEPTETDCDDFLYGAYLAGSSFAVAGSGLHHKICHALGGAFDLPHAETHAVILPWVLEFNAPAVPDAADRIADALGVEDAVAGLAELNRELGAPNTLSQIGLRPDQLDEAIDIVGAILPIPNPRPVERADIAAILTAAFGPED